MSLSHLEVEHSLLEEHGPSVFPFLKALRLEGQERLAPVSVPNLCQVANTRKRSEDPTFLGHKSTTEQLSHTPAYEVDAALAKTPSRRRLLEARDAEGLKLAFGVTEQVSVSLWHPVRPHLLQI